MRCSAKRCTASGIALDSAFVTIPGLQRITSLRHSASKTRVNALLVLRRARETRAALYCLRFPDAVQREAVRR